MEWDEIEMPYQDATSRIKERDEHNLDQDS
jgi:hypothetical protein